MDTLDSLIPMPRLLELDHVDLAASPGRVWGLVRHGDLGRSPLIRALFAVRTLPDRLAGRKAPPGGVRIDDMVSTPEGPGFQVLAEDPGHEVAVGAVGKVWRLDIPFVHVPGAEAFARFDAEGFVKVAWALRVVPRGAEDARLEIEVRVDATDEESWRKFRRYFRVIGPASRFIRRSALAAMARELGTPGGEENERPLPGDELLPDASEQITHGITIAAPPAKVWPWLVQMGCGRGGFYSYDLIDNGGVPSARELHPEWTAIKVGDVLPAEPEEGNGGFEVLRLEEPRTLILGGLFDVGAGRQQPFAAARPGEYWHVTWAFVLEPLDAGTTRLHVRARAAFSSGKRLHAAWIRPVHHFMEGAQLRNLAARAEGRLRADGWRDVVEGVGGAAQIAFHLATPFLRRSRTHWGVDAEVAAKAHPGDGLVAAPTWSWTHGVEIEAPAEAVWGWVAQVGADRAGFYSYQWLENVVGCELRNAERVHPEWQVKKGDHLRLHPEMAPLSVVDVAPRRHFVAFAEADEVARAAGVPWAAVSWLFLVEPLGPARCRFVSRLRCASSDDLATRLSVGPTFFEPIGFAMDRRMLLGVKERAERAARQQPVVPAGNGAAV